MRKVLDGPIGEEILKASRSMGWWGSRSTTAVAFLLHVKKPIKGLGT